MHDDGFARAKAAIARWLEDLKEWRPRRIQSADGRPPELLWRHGDGEDYERAPVTEAECAAAGWDAGGDAWQPPAGMQYVRDAAGNPVLERVGDEEEVRRVLEATTGATSSGGEIRMPVLEYADGRRGRQPLTPEEYLAAGWRRVSVPAFPTEQWAPWQRARKLNDSTQALIAAAWELGIDPAPAYPLLTGGDALEVLECCDRIKRLLIVPMQLKVASARPDDLLPIDEAARRAGWLMNKGGRCYRARRAARWKHEPLPTVQVEGKMHARVSDCVAWKDRQEEKARAFTRSTTKVREKNMSQGGAATNPQSPPGPEHPVERAARKGKGRS